MQSKKPSAIRFSRGICQWAFPAAILLAGSLPVHAETLKEALTAAYLFNPTLKAARAQLRATDNGVALAKSGYRPTVSAAFQDGYENSRTRPAKPMPGYRHAPTPRLRAPARRGRFR